MGRKGKVLFVCSGNTCRSPMAEGIFRQLLGAYGVEGVEVSSAGLYALEGMPASEEAVTVLAEWGIDISGHRARRVTQEMLAEADLVLAMTERHKAHLLELAPEAKEKIFTLGEYAGRPKDVDDPIGLPLYYYRQYAEEIRQLCRLALERFLEEQER
ncbi:low molecular weight protein arginine phosphatase [Ammonifex thiophilus]|uniref:low molecular weight protein arginine phosphatase n=1 Tax=Ammonifex thiophilus TaxID=444093 RepID=UPI001F0B9EF4|nr:low molecular weight protein arginine phosphatase [Ammonifex thiophilus]RLL92866.1 low molecular weight tyrosine phosphatase [Ammonifex thiophilus]